MLKRILSILLALLMLCGTMLTTASCGDSEDTDTVGESQTVADDAPFGVPEDLDYNNEEFTILGYNWNNREYFDDKLTLDQRTNVDNALLRRDTFVEEYLGIELNLIIENGQWADCKEFSNKAINSIMSGDGEFDLITAYSLSPSILMLNNCLEDLRKVDYVDFTQAWWPGHMLTTCTVNDRTYFMSGDASSNLLFQLQAIAFDEVALKDNRIDEAEIYALVDNGGWTIEKFFNIASNVSASDDDVWNNSDYYAIGISDVLLDSFYFATGHKLLEQKNGILQISDDILSESILDIYDMVYNAVYVDHVMYDANLGGNPFRTGNSMFQISTLNTIKGYVTDLDVEVGLLPFPKYSEDDSSYRSLTSSPHSQFCIPTDAKNKKMSAAMLETLAYASYDMVTPVIYEESMQLRYSKDSNSSRMYDIIRAGATTDIGILLYFSFVRDPQSLFRNAVKKQTDNWTSNYKNLYEADMKKVVTEINTFFTD